MIMCARDPTRSSRSSCLSSASELENASTSGRSCAPPEAAPFLFQAEDGIRDRDVTWSSDVCSSDLILGEGEPKYLNSPDTAIFHKGKLLYNLHVAKHAIRKAERAILVEGYFDVLRLSLAGIERSEERRVGKGWRYGGALHVEEGHRP